MASPDCVLRVRSSLDKGNIRLSVCKALLRGQGFASVQVGHSSETFCSSSPLDLKTCVREEGRKTFKMAAPTLYHAHVRLVLFFLLNDDRSVLAWFVSPRSLSVRRMRLLDNGIKGGNVRRVWQ